MAKRTPAGQTRTGHLAKESKPDARGKGTDPEPIGKLELENEDSGPVGRPRSGSSGAEDMYQLDAERVPFEEPTRTDTVRERPMDEGDE